MIPDLNKLQRPHVGHYIGRKVPRSSNAAGWGSDVDLRTGVRLWDEEMAEPGLPREYATPLGAVSAAKRLVLKGDGRIDVLVFVIGQDPHRDNATVLRFVGHAVWDEQNRCARGGVA